MFADPPLDKLCSIASGGMISCIQALHVNDKSLAKLIKSSRHANSLYFFVKLYELLHIIYQSTLTQQYWGYIRGNSP